jgi:tellurite resistance protein TerC
MTMDFLFADWLGTPLWFWLAFFGIVVALTAFDLGILHKEDAEMGIGESLKLSAFYISIALLFGVWVWIQKGADLGMKYYTGLLHRKSAVDRQRVRDQPHFHLFRDPA